MIYFQKCLSAYAASELHKRVKQLSLPLALILAGALVGLFFSAVLIYEHNGAKTEIGASVCGIDDTSSCKKAADSALGKPFGVPLALIGFFYYGALAAVGMLLVFVLYDLALDTLFWAALAGIAFDLFLLVYSVLILGSICRLCVITYCGTILIALGAWLLKKRGEKMIKPEKLSVSGKVAFSAVVVATLALGFFFQVNAESREAPQAKSEMTEEQKDLIRKINAEFYKQWKAGEIVAIDKPTTGAKGGARPVLTITEFADALCPHCKSMGIVLNDFVKKYPEKVRVIFRHYPLDIQCNNAMKNKFHIGACDLARAMECGEAQGKFWPMHDGVFMGQDTFMREPVTDKSIEGVANQAGLQSASFMSCYRSNATLGKVKADIAQGNRIKITGTPTTIINDRRLPGIPLEYVPGLLEKILEEESKK